MGGSCNVIPECCSPSQGCLFLFLLHPKVMEDLYGALHLQIFLIFFFSTFPSFFQHQKTQSKKTQKRTNHDDNLKKPRFLHDWLKPPPTRCVQLHLKHSVKIAGHSLLALRGSETISFGSTSWRMSANIGGEGDIYRLSNQIKSNQSCPILSDPILSYHV